MTLDNEGSKYNEGEARVVIAYIKELIKVKRFILSGFLFLLS